MTLKDALQEGYTYGGTSWSRGYVSRKADPLEQEVRQAGGSRKGQFYVLLASKTSSTYCVRQYLRKEAK